MNYRWLIILGAALAVGLVAAVVMPRIASAEGTAWGVTLALAALAAAAAALLTRERVDDGKTVRDDARTPR